MGQLSMSHAHSKNAPTPTVGSPPWPPLVAAFHVHLTLSPLSKLNPSRSPRLWSHVALFLQHGLVNRRQRPDSGPHEHPHTAPGNPPFHNPRTRARPSAPHVYHPGCDGLDGVETDRIVPAFSFQIDEPAPQQRQEDARDEPEAERTPEGSREQGEEIGHLEGQFRRPERRHRGQGRQVAQGQHLIAQSPRFDEQREQLDARHRAELAAHALEGRRQRRACYVVGNRGPEAGGVGVYLVREHGG